MLAPHCLDAGGTIDVNDGWDAVLPFRAHLLGPQHERRFVLADENVRCPLIEHDRRKRAKSLSELNPLVQFVLHVGPSRIGQDAPLAERARSEFGAALEPAEHVTLRKQLCRFATNALVAPVEDPAVDQQPIAGALHDAIRVFEAERRLLHHKSAWLFLYCQMAIIRTANRDPVVASGKLDPGIIESGLALDSTVNDAIQRHPTGKAQVLGARRFT